MALQWLRIIRFSMIKDDLRVLNMSENHRRFSRGGRQKM